MASPCAHIKFYSVDWAGHVYIAHAQENSIISAINFDEQMVLSSLYRWMDGAPLGWRSLVY